MSRLIDADAIIGFMLEHNTPDSLFASVEEIVAYQPIAYNVEEVVKELEEYAEQHKDYYQIGEDFIGYGACIPLNKAIEIVRKGGVK